VKLFTTASMNFISYASNDFAKAEYYNLHSIYWLAMHPIGGILVAFDCKKHSDI